MRKDEDLYARRNSTVLEAALKAKCKGYEVGIRSPIEDKDWPVIFITLPRVGEVSWHVRAGDISPRFGFLEKEKSYTGYSLLEKYNKILLWCEKPTMENNPTLQEEIAICGAFRDSLV
jgi:hypothetical protein